jgi:hypothetical protein
MDLSNARASTASRSMTGACLKMGAETMPIASPRYAFTAVMVAGAPADPGVYALWRGDELIYYGSAQGGEATIQSRLRAHLEGTAALCTSGATHYGWEISSHPRGREAELLREYQNSNGRLPRCNAA